MRGGPGHSPRAKATASASLQEPQRIIMPVVRIERTPGLWWAHASDLRCVRLTETAEFAQPGFLY